MTLFRDRGVVLRTYRLGEADRIIVLLTEQHGKVRAVAKGVRRTSSRFGARLEPLGNVALLLWQGRGDLDTVNQVEVIDPHPRLRADLDRVAGGMSMLEVADQVAQERHPDPALYAMLVGALQVLDDPDRDPTLVAPAFFLKTLVLEGAGPVLDSCVSCGATGDGAQLVAFSMVDGGMLCRSCRRGRPVGPEALALMRRILGGSLGSVLASSAPPGAEEVTAIATEAIEVHLDRRLRTVRSVVGL
jgi:DNA repair protein RecO (recombination protein O)